MLTLQVKTAPATKVTSLWSQTRERLSSPRSAALPVWPVAARAHHRRRHDRAGLEAAISRLDSSMYSAQSAAPGAHRESPPHPQPGDRRRLSLPGELGAGSYAINRMLPGANNSWSVDNGTATRTVTMPTSVTVAQGTGTYEFDTRGTTVGANALTTLRLHDSTRNYDVDVRLWPSGQVF